MSHLSNHLQSHADTTRDYVEFGSAESWRMCHRRTTCWIALQSRQLALVMLLRRVGPHWGSMARTRLMQQQTNGSPLSFAGVKLADATPSLPTWKAPVCVPDNVIDTGLSI